MSKMAQPFDENPIGHFRRNRYGQYRERYSKGRKADETSCTYVRLSGFTYVKLNLWGFGDSITKPRWSDTQINYVKIIEAGGLDPMVGTPIFYLKINNVMIYPSDAGGVGTPLDTWVNLGFEWMKVRMGEELEVWVRSTDAGDGIVNTASVCAQMKAITKLEDYSDDFI
jgi:hypothetical protein